MHIMKRMGGVYFIGCMDGCDLGIGFAYDIVPESLKSKYPWAEHLPHLDGANLPDSSWHPEMKKAYQARGIHVPMTPAPAPAAAPEETTTSVDDEQVVTLRRKFHPELPEQLVARAAGDRQGVSRVKSAGVRRQEGKRAWKNRLYEARPPAHHLAERL